MSTFYPSPPQHQQRRVNQTLEIPRSSYPTQSHQQGGLSPYNAHVRYNPALYNGGGASTPISPYNPRVPSASPHRGGDMGYNPQNFGGLEYGRVVTPPVQSFIQPQTTGDAPPPPYSPPLNNPNTPAPPPPRQTPNSQVQRIQTQSWQGAFSPISPPFVHSTTSSQGTTPLSPYPPQSGFPHQRRNYSPPAPTSNLQHETTFERIGEVVPPPPPGPPPPQQHQSQQQQQSQQHQQQQQQPRPQQRRQQQQPQQTVSLPPPPPPPGPPPSTQRVDRPHRANLQSGAIEAIARQAARTPQQSGRNDPQQQSPRSLNDMYSRTTSLVATMANRGIPSTSTTPASASGQFQTSQISQLQNQYQHQSQPQQPYQAPTPVPSSTRTPANSQASSSQQPQQSQQTADYHHPQVPAPVPPPKRKMSIDVGHEAQLRQSPRLTIPGQTNPGTMSEVRSPIEHSSNNPWTRVLANSPSPANQPPRQLLTPPPTSQEHEDLVDLSSSKSEPTERDTYTTAAARHTAMIAAESSAASDDAKMKVFIEWVKEEWQIREGKYGAENMRKLGAKTGLVLRPRRESIVPGLPNIDADVMMGGTGLNRNRSGNRKVLQWWGQREDESLPVSPTTGPGAVFSSLHGFGRRGPRSLLSAAFPESTVDDGERSRGRASSRWWETSVNGDSASEFGFVRSDGVGGGPVRQGRRMTKSSLREIAMEATNRYSIISGATISTDAASFMGRAEYPPDFKGGVQGVAPSSGISTGYSQQTPQQQQQRQPPHYTHPGQLQVIQEQQHTPQPPQPRRPIVRLDILPLLTLLPPYPRVYPAVNNCHPQLAEFRNLVRNLNDLDELHKVTDDFAASAQKIKEANAMEARKRRHQHSDGVQRLYQEGKINYDQVDAMDQDFEADENDRKVSELKSEFDRFQNEVVDIVHSGLMERIALASEAYEQVQSEIVGSNTIQNATSRDREGDEIPELLEKLTLLKWLFDLREVLHRKVYDLLRDRNRRYKELIVTPFYNTRQGDRIREAEEFFTKDENARRVEADKASLRRFEEFLEIMEENVIKGVEVQISCFWDVAPLVSECFEKIPQDLENVQPIVPPEEAHENPSYEENPLIYLKEKVYFAERSCYQFVEAQTNLLCLLHEVKTSLVKAKYRLLSSESPSTKVDADEAEEERKLTDDLKEKVKLLESEWKLAIGNQFAEVSDKLERQVVGGNVVDGA